MHKRLWSSLRQLKLWSVSDRYWFLWNHTTPPIHSISKHALFRWIHPSLFQIFEIQDIPFTTYLVCLWFVTIVGWKITHFCGRFIVWINGDLIIGNTHTATHNPIIHYVSKTKDMFYPQNLFEIYLNSKVNYINLIYSSPIEPLYFHETIVFFVFGTDCVNSLRTSYAYVLEMVS